MGGGMGNNTSGIEGSARWRLLYDSLKISKLS